MPDSKSLTLPCSQYLLSWLQEANISLAFTTYQTNRLFLIGRKPDGTLSTTEHRYATRLLPVRGERSPPQKPE